MNVVKSGRRRSVAAVAVAAFTFAPCVPSLSPRRKPRRFASAKTPFVEISVDVDEALKPFAGLFDNCAAEAKSYAAAMRAQAEKEHRENPSAFRDGMAWTYDRDYALRSAVGRYISIVRSDDTFEGGAHPNQDSIPFSGTRSARSASRIRPFFTETADNGPTMTALAQLPSSPSRARRSPTTFRSGDDDKLPANITPAQYLRKDTFINDGIKPSLLNLGPVTLAPSTEAGKSSGLTFHYRPYAVGPYAEGVPIPSSCRGPPSGNICRRTAPRCSAATRPNERRRQMVNAAAATSTTAAQAA